jgi:hypothetical protein
MDYYFWGNTFEYFKDRRIAGVFFGSLMAIGGLIFAGFIAAQIFVACNLQDYLGYIVPGCAGIFALLFAVWIIRARRRMLARRKDRYKISPMSRDELNKARSKLMAHKR